MSREPESIDYWSEEVAYVRSIDRAVTETGDPGNQFNHNIKCFERYCKMQAKFCDADGYPELAYLIWSEAF